MSSSINEHYLQSQIKIKDNQRNKIDKLRENFQEMRRTKMLVEDLSNFPS